MIVPEDPKSTEGITSFYRYRWIIMLCMQKFSKSNIGLNFEVGEVTMFVRFTISGLKLSQFWSRRSDHVRFMITDIATNVAGMWWAGARFKWWSLRRCPESLLWKAGFSENEAGELYFSFSDRFEDCSRWGLSPRSVTARIGPSAYGSETWKMQPVWWLYTSRARCNT